MRTFKLTIMVIIFLLLGISFTSALTISSVRTTPDEVEPGSNVDVSLEIKNNQNDDVTDVTVSLDLSQVDFAPYQSSNEETIARINEDDEEKVSFGLTALSSTESGTHKIPVKISYTYNSARETTTSYISIVINAKPSLKLDYIGNLIKGQNNNLGLKIINSGLSQVKLLSLEVRETSGIKFSGSRYVYIGDIESNDFDSADFSAFVSETAGSSIILPVKLNYRDALNQVQEENLNLAIKTYTKEEATQLGIISKNNTTKYIIGVVVLIILYLVYRSWKKRKKKNSISS